MRKRFEQQFVLGKLYQLRFEFTVKENDDFYLCIKKKSKINQRISKKYYYFCAVLFLGFLSVILVAYFIKNVV